MKLSDEIVGKFVEEKTSPTVPKSHNNLQLLECQFRPKFAYLEFLGWLVH